MRADCQAAGPDDATCTEFYAHRGYEHHDHHRNVSWPEHASTQETEPCPAG